MFSLQTRGMPLGHNFRMAGTRTAASLAYEYTQPRVYAASEQPGERIATLTFKDG